VKIFKHFAIVTMVISTIAQGQEAKNNLRNFTPKYAIDSFQLKGNASQLKRRVIDIQQNEGIRSAYWDDESSVLTVQYNDRLVELSAIKNFFLNHEYLVQTNKVEIDGLKLSFDCCKVESYHLTSKK